MEEELEKQISEQRDGGKSKEEDTRAAPPTPFQFLHSARRGSRTLPNSPCQIPPLLCVSRLLLRLGIAMAGAGCVLGVRGRGEGVDLAAAHDLTTLRLSLHQHVSAVFLLREYIDKEFKDGDFSAAPNGYELERVIGNTSHLPHSLPPSLPPSLPIVWTSRLCH